MYSKITGFIQIRVILIIGLSKPYRYMYSFLRVSYYIVIHLVLSMPEPMLKTTSKTTEPVLSN